MKTSPEFVISKNLPLAARMRWIAGLAVVGIGIQLAMSVLVGWIVVFVAALMGAVRSQSNEPKGIGNSDWQNVTTAELQAAHKLLEESSKVRAKAGRFAGNSGTGCGLAALLAVSVAMVAILLCSVVDSGAPITLAPIMRGGSVGLLFALDCLTLIAPMWMYGLIRTWEPPMMRKRLEQLIFIYHRAAMDPRLEFQPSMQVAKTQDGTVPMDCKLMVKIKDSDPNFMGIQVQTSFNDVQGTKYPYTYCVLIAKPEFDLRAKAKQMIEMPPEGGFSSGLLGLFTTDNEKKESKFARFDGALVELKKQGEVDIAVVRQNTKGQGYHTKPDEAMEVFVAANKLAVGML